MYVESTQIADENEINEWFQVEEISPIAEPKPKATKSTRTREMGDATDMYLGEIGRADLLSAPGGGVRCKKAMRPLVRK